MQVEALIHFVSGVKAALELNLQDKQDSHAAAARQAMRAAYDTALSRLQKELHKVRACVGSVGDWVWDHTGWVLDQFEWFF